MQTLVGVCQWYNNKLQNKNKKKILLNCFEQEEKYLSPTAGNRKSTFVI